MDIVNCAGTRKSGGGLVGSGRAGGARRKRGSDPRASIKAPQRQRISEADAVWDLCFEGAWTISERAAAERKAAARECVLGKSRAKTDVAATKIQDTRSDGRDRIQAAAKSDARRRNERAEIARELLGEVSRRKAEPHFQRATAREKTSTATKKTSMVCV